MLKGIRRVVADGFAFDVRSDLGDARSFGLAGEIFVPTRIGIWGRCGKLGLDTLEASPEELHELARQCTPCE